MKITILDKNGIAIVSTDKPSVGSDKSADNVYFDREKNRPLLKIYILLKIYGIPAMDIAALVLLNGETIGVIIADLSMKELFEILSNRTGLGEI